MVLRQPERVLRVLAELRPMAAIGPVSLDEARDVLAERLLDAGTGPAAHRYGRVFVGGPQQARGRTFRVVFVAGLAERMFPLKPHEDPMLLDEEMRAPLAAGLAVQEDRGRNERLMLRLAVGSRDRAAVAVVPAHRRRRITSAGTVVLRARHHARDHRARAKPRRAPGACRHCGRGRAGVAVPGGAHPCDRRFRARPLGLRELLLTDNVKAVEGTRPLSAAAQRRAETIGIGPLVARRSSWTPFDGITRVTGTTGELLGRQRLGARPCSPSRAAEVLELSVPVPAVGCLPASACGRS